ncbi:diguanylate cyclase [Neptunomonas marina]|uniref:diguanylate cyclase n=1 Tax=Neptunomonas marina TaxID=1815562 RepID=A0A437Q5C1_9GAMM|nr:diguanylate cyclase [Neptunomonas marina]RVU29698.1 diguanylate cyclase [Neptunomonas marina]
MKLRKKLLVGLFTLFAVLSVAIVIVLNIMVLPEVARLEAAFQQKDFERVRMALEYEQKRLSTVAVDWAQWDDTYTFAETRSSDYIDSNFPTNQLDILDASFVIIRNAQDLLVLNVTEAPWETSIWREINQPLQSNPLRFISDEDDAASGLFWLGSRAYIISASPILNSESEGPIRGYFYIGRAIDESYQAAVSEMVQTSIELTASQKESAAKKKTLPDFVGSFSFVNAPDAELDVYWPRESVFYDEALKTIRYTVLTVLGIGLIAMAIAYVAFRHSVMLPLTLLIRQTEEFGEKKAMRAFRALRRDDEFGELSASFKRMAQKLSESWWLLERERSDFERASVTDALTGLRNRRYLEQRLNDEALWQGEHQCAFFMLDIDLFKRINDHYGHDVGDVVLQQFAALLQEECREQDILVRYGGEEFTIVAQGLGFDAAKGVAERIRRRIETEVFGGTAAQVYLSCSVGFFCVDKIAQQHLQTYWPDMLKVADIALYLCKRNGRNTWLGLDAVDIDRIQPCPVSSQDLRQYVQQGVMQLSSHRAEEDKLVWF